MPETNSIVWEAPEHRHVEKTSDWFWIVAIIALSASVVSIILGNVLFGVVILLGAATVIVSGNRPPRILTFEISLRGIRIEDRLYPFASLEEFGIDIDAPEGPQLIVKSKHFFMQLLIIPIPPEYVEEIDDILGTKLIEAPLEEPLGHRLLEFFGF